MMKINEEQFDTVWHYLTPLIMSIQVTSYYRYLVASGMFQKVMIHYLVTGHTKFSSDRMFGWMSFLLRKFDVFTFDNIVDIINMQMSQSYKAVKYILQLINDWTPYIYKNYRMIKGITDWHLAVVEKVRNNITTTTTTIIIIIVKKSSSHRRWIKIEHVKLKKQTTFALCPIQKTKLPDKRWSALNSTIDYVVEVQKLLRLKFF